MYKLSINNTTILKDNYYNLTSQTVACSLSDNKLNNYEYIRIVSSIYIVYGPTHVAKPGGRKRI